MSTYWHKSELAEMRYSVNLTWENLDLGTYKRNMIVAHPDLINEIVMKIVEMKNAYIGVHLC